ncbi:MULTISPECIES: hypothetical protein [Erwinia]|uniref:hypothetical protein n=1 Tax=Erwinia TaxID=551 RepID=UPI000551A67A|nr:MULTISPECIES: hypothetical protein [Erwinia]
MNSRILNILFSSALLAIALFTIALYFHNTHPKIAHHMPDHLNDIRYSIDECSLKNGVFVIRGWAILTKGSPEKLTRLYLETNGELFPVYKKTLKSDDLKRLFGEGKKHGMSAFYGATRIDSSTDNLSVIISVEDMDGRIHETKYKCQ